MYSAILKTSILPLLDLKGQTTHLRCLQSLEKSQWFSPTQMQELQNRKLRTLLKHAYETVPFYRRRFKEANLGPDTIKDVRQLARLPRLTKREITHNLSKLLSTRVPKWKLTPFATGGSTGEPLRFFKDRRTTSWALAATTRSYRWAGLDLGDKYLILWSSPFDLSVSKKISGFLHEQLMRYKILPTSQMSNESMAQYVTIIKKHRPKSLKGYASALVLFASYLRQQGITDLGLRSVISTAESLLPADRRLLQEQFDCDVYDTYGSREIALMAGECNEHSGLHISAETVVLEFVRDGENAADGELGEILVTDLQNYGMPLIRYSIGDAGRPTSAACPCGRGLPLIKSVDGRLTDFIRASDGRQVPGPAFIYFFSDFPVKKYQIVQTELNKLVVKIIKDEGYSSNNDEKIAARIREIVGEAIEIEVKHVEHIPCSQRSGKFLAVVSEIPTFGPR